MENREDKLPLLDGALHPDHPKNSSYRRAQPQGIPLTPDLILSHHGLRQSGGIERYLMTLVDGLHRRGIRPTVVAHRFDTKMLEYGWVNPLLIRTWGLGDALRDHWIDHRLRRPKARRGWYPLIALSQTATADIAICGGTHPGDLAATAKTAGWRDRLSIALERRHLQGAGGVIAYRAIDCTVMASRFKPFGLVGVESVPCGSPLFGALLRWRAGQPRVHDLRAALRYDPSVAAHLEALLGWVDRLRAAPRR